jgi:hypothetical protein
MTFLVILRLSKTELRLQEVKESKPNNQSSHLE